MFHQIKIVSQIEELTARQEDKAALRRQLARDVEDYLRRGKTITQLETQASRVEQLTEVQRKAARAKARNVKHTSNKELFHGPDLSI